MSHVGRDAAAATLASRRLSGLATLTSRRLSSLSGGCLPGLAATHQLAAAALSGSRLLPGSRLPRSLSTLSGGGLAALA